MSDEDKWFFEGNWPGETVWVKKMYLDGITNNKGELKMEGQTEKDFCNVNISGFEVELQQLPMVAERLSILDLSRVNDQELKELCIKSRLYLLLLLDKAIARTEIR